MKASLLRRASVLAVPAVTCAWTHLAMAQAPAPAAAPAAPAAAPAAPPAPKWYEKAKVEGFVDAYSSWNFNFPKPQFGSNNGRAFDISNGFALHWAGVNVSYAPDPTAGSPVGGFVGLRFGPGAYIYNGGALAPTGFTASPDIVLGAGNVKEAYVSWKPDPKVQLDLGKFSTWIGAEVADSQYNMTYTRSALFSTQPLFHTGLRVDLPLADQFDLKLFVVNGVNNTLDNNSGKSFGVAANFIANKEMSFYLNYMGGPEQNDIAVGIDPMTGLPTGAVSEDKDANGRWRHLIDVIADMHFDKAHVLINGDFGTEKLDALSNKATWFGANATLGYAVTDMFAVALRGGFTADSDGAFVAALWGAPTNCAAMGAAAPVSCKTKVIDATLTLAATPTPNLIIKLEPRVDSVSSDATGYQGVYRKGLGGPNDFSKTMFTTTIGAVVTTN